MKRRSFLVGAGSSAVIAARDVYARPIHAGGGFVVPPMGTALVTSTPSAGGTQNMDLLVGFEFVPASNITVSALARWKLSGDTHTHTISLFDTSVNSVLPGGSVSVNMTGPPANAFAYVNLTAPIVLIAGRGYYLLSAESATGDPFLNPQAITTTADAMVGTAIYGGLNFTGFNAFPGGSQSQGAVNLLYTVGGSPGNALAGSATPPITLDGQSPPSLALRQDGYLVLQTNVLAGTSSGVTGKVVSGTLTIGGNYTYGIGGGGPTPGPGEIVIQPMVDGAPFGSLVTGGSSMSWTLDTTLLADGTHSIGAKAVSTSTASLRTSQIGWLPLTLIVNNHGLITGSQTIPVTMWNTNGQDSTERFFPSLPDFVTFPGIGSLPLHNTAYDYPDVAPAPSSNSIYRLFGNYYQESVVAPFSEQYNPNNYFETTQYGGVFANPLRGQFVLDIFGSYNQAKCQPIFDGHRLDNMVTSYTTYREYPDGHAWIGADLFGRVFEQKYTGQVTTVYGTTRNRALLQIDHTDTTVSDGQLDAESTFVGTIGSPSFGDTRGLNDICFDPRDISLNSTGNFTARIDPSGGPTLWLMTVTVAPSSPIKPGMYVTQSGAVIGYVSSNQSGSGGTGTYNVRLASTIGSSVMTAGFSQTIYLAKTIDHCILKVNLGTGVGVLYAGIVGTPGSHDDPFGTSATFNEPFGCVMATDGTLYVADSANNAIRAVSPSGTNAVTTLIGNQQPIGVVVGGTVTYPTSGSITMTYVSTTSGVATIHVVMPNPTILTGQTRAGKGCAVQISGVINSGTANLNNSLFDGDTAWFLNGFTSNQDFTIAVNVGTATVGTISGTIQLIAYNNDLYSPPGTVSYAGGHLTQYAFFPQAVDFDSQGRLCFSETNTGCVRRIDLAAQTITRLGWCFGHAANPSDQGFMWMTVNSDACCGPLDDVMMSSGDQQFYVISEDGTYQSMLANESYFAFGEGFGAPGYPWDVAYSHHWGRFMINGVSQDAGPANSSRIAQGGDPRPSISPPVDWDGTGWSYGMVIFEYGTIPTMPFNSRPSLKSLMGARGCNYLGMPTFADLNVTYPTDPALAAYIQAGMGGAVPRPEITGRWMTYLIYFIRRSTLAGSYPTPVTVGPLDPDYTPPLITAISTMRNSSTQVTVSFTTDKPCFCVLSCGTPHDAALSPGLLPLYGQFALESSFTSGVHTITATGLANIQPTHYSITANDLAGNCSHTADDTIA